MAKRTQAFYDQWLANWIELVRGIDECSEREIIELLAYEQANKNRPSFTGRLHQRLNKLRADRERQMIADGKFLDYESLKGAAK